MKKKELIKILVEEYGEDKAELKELDKEDLKTMLENREDTSCMHPNETLDEFMEHEDI